MLETEKPQSAWTTLKDYSQSLITLASALLALSVTFSSTLISKIGQVEKTLLLISWLCLVFVIACGAITQSFLINYLRYGNTKPAKPEKGNSYWAVLFANSAFLSLVVAAIVFLIFGFFVVKSMPIWDADVSVQKVLASMPEISGKPDSKWIVQALNWNEESKSYQLNVIDQNSTAKYSIKIDTVRGKITDIQKMP
jgi:hypothetical protein